jgi:hypothetical protein
MEQASEAEFAHNTCQKKMGRPKTKTNKQLTNPKQQRARHPQPAQQLG